MDLQQLPEIERLVKEISLQEKLLHVLVNNAGVGWGEDIDGHTVRFLRLSNPTMCSHIIVGRSIYPNTDYRLAASFHPHAEVSASPSRRGESRRT